MAVAAAEMSVEYVIICDGCGRVVAGSAAAVHAARLDVEASGGKTGLRGGRDLCRKCVHDGVKPR